ncbi:MAG: hypothetical protein KJ601_06460 [Nanoarchaeota archaeon]|nr:hypothetical protein [Nanoarchaeota archaeon]MBU1704309.1 hypothetical protein [Nanoarchaeota archaeon]
MRKPVAVFAFIYFVISLITGIITIDAGKEADKSIFYLILIIYVIIGIGMAIAILFKKKWALIVMILMIAISAIFKIGVSIETGYFTLPTMDLLLLAFALGSIRNFDKGSTKEGKSDLTKFYRVTFYVFGFIAFILISIMGISGNVALPGHFYFYPLTLLGIAGIISTIFLIKKKFAVKHYQILLGVSIVYIFSWLKWYDVSLDIIMVICLVLLVSANKLFKK